MAIVAAQTGYPSDLLDVDLDLEADLGIDTVKQAETFAAIRAAYDIERDDRLALRDYPTLRHVIAFVHERAPRFATTAPTAAPPAAELAPRRPRPRPRRRPGTGSRSRSWPSWPHRPATPPTCSTSTSTSKPTSASTP